MNFSTLIAWAKALAQLNQLAAYQAQDVKDKQAIMDDVTQLQQDQDAIKTATLAAFERANKRIDDLIASGSGATHDQLAALHAKNVEELALLTAAFQPPAPPEAEG